MKNNIRYSFTACLLSLLFCLNTFALPVMEKTNASSEEGAVFAETQAVLEGDGTEYAPYLITNAEDFLTAAKMVNENGSEYGDKVYSIQACIDFSDVEFVPMGTESSPFNGILVGNGHVLSNIKVRDTENFGVVGYMKQGKITDVHAVYGEVTAQLNIIQSLGGIVGKIYTVDMVTVSGCSASGNLHLSLGNNVNAGGIVGTINATSAAIEFKQCVSYMSLDIVTEKKCNAGGFGGYFFNNSGKQYNVENCISTGNVTVNKNADDVLDVSNAVCYAGGFAGWMKADEPSWSPWASDAAFVENCIALGDVYVKGKFDSKGGKFTGYENLYSDDCIVNCAVSSSQSIDADNVTDIVEETDVSNLKDRDYLAKSFFYDFADVWGMTFNGEMYLQGICSGCPEIDTAAKAVTLSASEGIQAKGFDGMYILALASYKENVLTGLRFVPFFGEYSAALDEVGLDIGDADKLCAFVFAPVDFVKPVTQAVSISLA